jgi:hypothetical protein
MQLEFLVEDNRPVFHWKCSKCGKSIPYISEIDIDFTKDDFKPLVDSMSDKTPVEQEAIRNEIKVQMVDILQHFIECGRASHYNELFKSLIKPYLDNTSVLDYVLKSGLVKNDKVIIGSTRAKIFPELLDYLMSVDSPKITTYLKEEFKTQHT